MALATVIFSCSIVPVMANEVARFSSNQALSTISWALVPAAPGQSATNTSHTLSWSVNNGFAYSYFVLRNTGNTVISSYEMQVNQTRVGGNGVVNQIDFEQCLGGSWDAASNACSGSVLLLGSAANGSFQFLSNPLGVGAETSIRAKTNINGRNNFVTQISGVVSRNSVRPGQLLNQ